MAAPNPILVVRGHIDDASQSINDVSQSLADISLAIPTLFPAGPGALPPGLMAAINQLVISNQQIQQDINQMMLLMQPVQQIPLLVARVANGGYNHALGDNIEWPPAPAVPAGLPPLPPLPATWAGVKQMNNAALAAILLAYNVVPAGNKPAKLKQIQRYIGLRLKTINPND